MRSRRQTMSELPQYRLSPLSLVMFSGALLLCLHARRVRAEDYFDPQALEITSGQQQTSDLSYFPMRAGRNPDVIG